MNIFQLPSYPHENIPQPTSPAPPSKMKIVIALLIIIAVSAVLILLFFSSVIFGKPDKPNIVNTAITRLTGSGKNATIVKILPSDINYLANEIGAYTLHDNPITKEKPEIEIYISDTSQYFDVTVDKNVPETVEAKSSSPDMKIITDSKTLSEVLTSDSLNKDVLTYYKDGKIIVVVMKTFDVLFLKGYKEIYSSLNAGAVPGNTNVLTDILSKLTFPNQSPQGFYL